MMLKEAKIRPGGYRTSGRYPFGKKTLICRLPDVFDHREQFCLRAEIITGTENIKLKIKGGRVEWRSKMVDKEKKESILDLSR